MSEKHYLVDKIIAEAVLSKRRYTGSRKNDQANNNGLLTYPPNMLVNDLMLL